MKDQIRVQNNTISIGSARFTFPSETTIKKILEFRKVVCFSTWPLEEDLDWNNPETHKIWKDRCLKNPSKLYCYSYSGNLLWEFPHDNVVGIASEIPEAMKPEDFISKEHYENYIKKFGGEELLLVYSGDYMFKVDANTGEIYSKNATR